MNDHLFSTVINKMGLTDMAAFCQINGRFSDYRKDVWFFGLLTRAGQEGPARELQKCTELLEIRRQRTEAGYLCLSRLENRMSPDQVAFYRDVRREFDENPHELALSFRFEDSTLQDSLIVRFHQVLRTYREGAPGASPSMLENFSVRLLFWIDLYFPALFAGKLILAASPKFLYSGPLKWPEYLFLYFLVQSGCDVLFLVEQDRFCLDEKWKNLAMIRPFQESLLFKKEHSPTAPVSAPRRPIAAACPASPVPERRPGVSPPAAGSAPVTRQPIRPSLARPPKRTKPPAGSRPPGTPPASRPAALPARAQTPSVPAGRPSAASYRPAPSREPLSYEELAKLAASVVMIQVFDRNNQCFKTGSGVFIGEEGYILTNFHVVSDGAYYRVQLEGETETHPTDDLLKYHPLSDLALLRIDRRCHPIPLMKQGETLVRGQKVVAIGSPLGLFNSVSDGIISGFRDIDGHSMIQFTAPTSHGSSGGALLNLYGELIGILTAGFDNGQNLNLAVDIKTISQFCRGFLPSQ
ncbi:trypsin-like peptidase domain-containing protein [Cuneatibacter sp. NSJ-177]|uniref:S1 family peptidase n=1 Tax=Cuneatibacter sp. NSJ-177 TaxID=2931401 RepID=UPI001FD259E7|nr:serine protease [Cuneatibacter sp. NSJ-177]MCJ7835024.1 trypsin-like peptidase domain-containing protein [Cuneatibacter sp. NSJ-177]